MKTQSNLILWTIIILLFVLHVTIAQDNQKAILAGAMVEVIEGRFTNLT